MNSKLRSRILAFAAGMIFTLDFVPGNLFAQGTAFTYQGRLNVGANIANGSYDMRFAIYDALTLGTQQGPMLTNAATAVSNGLFTVTLDFGNQFPGANRWLEIGVRTNGNGTFTVLAPRQALTPTPYAVFAATASNVNGTISVAQLPASVVTNNATGLTLTGTFSGNGASVTNVNAATLGGLTSGGFWKTNGNAGANPANGAFIGTTDNLPVEFKVNGQRALRLEPNAASPNLIGGYAGNVVNNGVSGATIVGGGNSVAPNQVGKNYATVLGGLGNVANGVASIAMGESTTASGDFSTAMGVNAIGSGAASTAMGVNTIASGPSSTAMGNGTTASGINSFASGEGSAASDLAATAMGYYTLASAPGATSLGVFSHAIHNNTFVWSDGTVNPFSSTGTNQFLVNASGGVGIGTPNPQGSLHVYSANNPTVVRVQSTGTPGFGRLEFVSNPQGDGSEWRPGYIQSTDNGGFVGGLAFFVNGAGAGSKFGNNEVMRVVNGAVGIGTATPVSALQVIGTVTATAFNPPSDRNLKENFSPVSPREVLDKVAALPISRWNFKGDATTPHVGPMAQDFHAAFNLGTDERHIATVDADGVALAAIQGLNQKLEEQRAANEELKQQVAELKQLVQTLVTKH